MGDTLNRIAHAIDRSAIQWVHMRHEEAGAFAAGAEAQLTGRLTACAGSCGPGSLHFINGLYEANRNRAPVILIASRIARQDLGFESIQEVDFVDVYRGCSVFCEMILTPKQARRKTVAACQAALTRQGVAVLVVPVDVANAAAHDELPYTVHARRPLVRPSDADLDEIAALLNKSNAITIYVGAGCAGAYDEVVATAARLKAPMAHTSRGKDFVEYDNPYNVGMTGISAGQPAITPSSTAMCCFCSARISPGPSSIRIARPSFRLMPIPRTSGGGIRWRSGPLVISSPPSTPCCHASRNTMITRS